MMLDRLSFAPYMSEERSMAPLSPPPVLNVCSQGYKLLAEAIWNTALDYGVPFP
jgi:hypothetical protein